MISQPTYLAARMVAEKIEFYFSQQFALAKERGAENLATIPQSFVIETIIDAAFWTSLRREEGYSPRISLAFLSPDQAEVPVLFKEKLSLNPEVLTKISPGVERAGVHLGVWYENNQLYVWGTTLQVPDSCFVLDVSEPGLLVIKHRRFYGYGKFVNVAVLRGDQVNLVDESHLKLDDCPPMLAFLLGHTPSSPENDILNGYVQLAVSMQAHKHGGTLLVVPQDNEDWRKSIISPVKYALSPAFTGLSSLVLASEDQRGEVGWKSAVKTQVDNIAGLTAIDGATVMSDKFELFAFGAKIGRKEGSRRVENIIIREPVVDHGERTVNPALTGGTRHLSAAQFVQDQKGTFALVASQDGHFTIFSWSASKELVQAYRIDTLLL